MTEFVVDNPLEKTVRLTLERATGAFEQETVTSKGNPLYFKIKNNRKLLCVPSAGAKNFIDIHSKAWGVFEYK